MPAHMRSYHSSVLAVCICGVTFHYWCSETGVGALKPTPVTCVSVNLKEYLPHLHLSNTTGSCFVILILLPSHLCCWRPHTDSQTHNASQAWTKANTGFPLGDVQSDARTSSGEHETACTQGKYLTSFKWQVHFSLRSTRPGGTVPREGS